MTHPNNIRHKEDLDWDMWENINQDKLEHLADFELRFVREVLQLIDISPCDVIPQYHFKDNNGKNRYIDFVLIVEENVLLPIELDGLSKMIDYDSTHEARYERFNDFLYRQNEIIKQFGLVLRYSNKHWINNPTQVADEIVSMMNYLYNQYLKSTEIGYIDRYQEVYADKYIEVEPIYPPVPKGIFSYLWTYVCFGWVFGYSHLHSFMRYKLNQRKQSIKSKKKRYRA